MRRKSMTATMIKIVDRTKIYNFDEIDSADSWLAILDMFIKLKLNR